MIPAGTVTRRAADDGDVVTRGVLDALRATPLLAPAGGPGAAPLPDVRPAAPLAIARLTTAGAAARSHTAAWLAAHRDGPAPDDGQEEALLHAVETSALTRPPLTRLTARIDAELAELYLGLARHWIDHAANRADPRFLNAALKLTAAALLAPVPATALAATALADILHAVDRLQARAQRIAASTPSTSAPQPTPSPPHAPPGGGLRITALAGTGSKGLPQFLAAADTAGLAVHSVLLYESGPDPVPPDSAYASAWYPKPAVPAPPPALRTHPNPAQQIGHRDWPALTRALKADGTDLLVLLGMDVVPADVLAAPTLGTINAHNGALPAYRGMDAAAWATLAGDPIACTAHLATKDVDAGDILAQASIPADVPDLRRAVKDAQIALLLDVCRQAAATGRLPEGRRQGAGGRRYYRMHPALRRLLDTRTPKSEGPR